MIRLERSKRKGETKADLKRQMNYWKIICVVLLLIIVGFFIWIYVSIFVLSPTESGGPALISNRKTVEFQTSTTKADLNKLIATYIDDFTKDEDIGYDVYVGNTVTFQAEAEFFNEPVQLTLKFSPKVVDDGNVLLTLQNLSVGALPLPVSSVMSFVSKQYKFPKWVTVIPKDKTIYLALDRLKLKGDTKVRADALNLKKDDISFTLLVPVK